MAKKNYFVGIDIGSSYVKTVLIDKDNEIIDTFLEKSGTNLEKSIKTSFDGIIAKTKISKDSIKHIAATGFGRKNIPFADIVKTEISCHAKGAYHFFPKKITLIDIGGQDTEIIKIDDNGKIISFKMNRKCAAGTGVFLEEIGYKLNIDFNEMNNIAKNSKKDISLSSFCTVFASTEILTKIKEGIKIEDMIKSAYESVVKRVIEMDTFEGDIVITGGVVAYNDIIVKILSKYVDNKILTPPYPQFIGAIGAALFSSSQKD